MKKIILALALMIVMITGCVTNELSKDDYIEKQLQGIYFGTYFSEIDNLDYPLMFELDEEKQLSFNSLKGKATIDKDYNIKGLVTDGYINLNYSGKIYFYSDRIEIEGTYTTQSDRGKFAIIKELHSQSNNNELEEEVMEKKYNYINDSLENITSDQLSIMQNSNIMIPGGYLELYELKNENVFGTPSDNITSYLVNVKTSTHIIEVKQWVYQMGEDLGWIVHQENDFDDGYGSFNVWFIRDSGIKNIFIGATEYDSLSFVTLRFD